MNALPVADARQVRERARRLLLSHPGALAVSLLLHVGAAVAALVPPWLLGRIVEDASRGRGEIAGPALLIAGAVVAQAGLSGYAWLLSARLSERMLAALREGFVRDLLRLPVATVERAGSGDLVTRVTRDLDVLAFSVRWAVPDSLVALLTVVLTLAALTVLSPLLALPCLVAVPVLWASTRWYLRRARAGYLAANASYSALTDGFAETVHGARTVEALGLADRRFRQVTEDAARSYAAERRTLWLRSIYLPIADTGYVLPVATTLVIGGLFYLHGAVSLAAATTATLYVQQVLGPVDRLLYWTDELQVAAASLARLLGAAGEPGPSASEQPRLPQGREIRLDDVRFAYRAGHDVLQGLDVQIAPGERIAVVGPSGAGKSTLGRLLAGIHPPRSGTVTVGGVPLDQLSPDELRRQVILVTQEHHVFHGTLRENLLLAAPDADDARLEEVLRAAGALDWAAELGLDAQLGSGATTLSPGQAQQLALARIVLADPRTLVLDEATSLLSPRTARRLERSLSALLAGRTVVAVAHRLHTAHDADRVIVMEDGRIVESGTHAELVTRGGPYAALWASWHGTADSEDVAGRPSPVGRREPTARRG